MSNKGKECYLPWYVAVLADNMCHILEPFHQFEADLVYLKVKKVILNEL
jgi:hypothetical protein